MDTMLGNIDLPDRLYFKFANLIYGAAGISLGDARRGLLRSRLSRRIRTLGLQSFDEYWSIVSRQDVLGDEFVEMLDAVSTNQTEFFREEQHFRFIGDTVLPALSIHGRTNRTRQLRFWSAGCSSGQEPYTLAMVVRESLPAGAAWQVRILATDISTRMLRIAREGVYEEGNIMAVPRRLRQRYMDREKRPRGDSYRIRADLKRMIAFRRLNLMEEEFPFSDEFDVILCRNVMIYFDRPTRERVVNRLYEHLVPGGYLFIGRRESLNSLESPFRLVQPSIYVRP
ncbi:methyltransferase [Candidatus Sumerlaeota bacterium]|nr:methyltransferase [Candidatus Sumerlaeota bacterium]